MSKKLLPVIAAVLVAVAMTPASHAADTAARHGKHRFAGIGSLSAPSGQGSFRFGVATSATQIEDNNHNTDWYKWTQPAPEGLGHNEFVGEGVDGYTLAIEDIALIKRMNLDSYRFGIEWARVEPRRDVIDESALRHYRELITALRANGIRPMVTIHHFANPVWVDDPADAGCANGPGDANLCGLDHPRGGELVVEEMAEHARLLAQRFGDVVDEWVTVNEPMVYMVFAHSFGIGPPGKANLTPETVQTFTRALRNYARAHVAMYRAVKGADRTDSDRDRVAASVGLTNGVQQYAAVRDGKISDNPLDIAARDRFKRYFDFSFLDSLWQGAFDNNLDGVMDESHPEWKGTLDWLGPQLYVRNGISDPSANPELPAFPVIDVQACPAAPCLPHVDPTYFVPTMGYESSPQGLYPVLKEVAERYPGIPLVVSESGLATESGKRRAEYLVRALEQIAKARAEGIDVRGYYHWSLLDNFEWLKGYPPRFGLYRVDRTTMERTPTEAVGVYAAIAGSRKLTPSIVSKYGGAGPLTPEPTG
ncbi:glycoside hydrolase family 1 protein [Actinokineospora sp.]|uniref:glycoside hydrolase family 1 protein n=1 Tax=Actinokineospora sp. TaxID=1872133 RepID=UPI004037CC0E